jgi:hypothetical protein
MDKELLLKARIPEYEYEIPGVGSIVIRPMTREEMHTITGRNKKDTLRGEVQVLAACMVDPKLSEDEVAQWQRSSPSGELSKIVNKIMELSGLTEDADKSDL